MHIPEAKSCNSMENGQQPSGPTLLDRWQTRTNHIGAVLVVAIHQSKYDIAAQIVAFWELEKGVWDFVLSCEALLLLCVPQFQLEYFPTFLSSATVLYKMAYDHCSPI